MSKLVEKIIDYRLRWFLEKINYLSEHQNGFANIEAHTIAYMTYKKRF